MTKQCYDIVSGHISELIANKIDTDTVFVSGDIYRELMRTHEFESVHRYETEFFRFMNYWIIKQDNLPENTIWSPL